MNIEEFSGLEKEIEETYYRLEELQKKHRYITGKNYIIPIRLETDPNFNPKEWHEAKKQTTKNGMKRKSGLRRTHKS